VSLISRTCPLAVAALCTGGSATTFIAAGGVVYRFERNVSVMEMSSEAHTANITHLLNFGTEILVSLDAKGTMLVWDANKGQVTMQCELGSSFKPTSLSHPSTYLNKVLVGGKGGLQLWNIHSGKLVYNFKSMHSVRSVTQSPVVDVIAVGFEDGRILLLNIRFDTELLSFKHQSGAVTSLSFGSYKGMGLLASGTSKGEGLPSF